jgi:hypothetical protein
MGNALLKVMLRSLLIPRNRLAETKVRERLPLVGCRPKAAEVPGQDPPTWKRTN